MTREQALRAIDIGSGEFVIDIGGGHRPFWRADLILEKYPFDSSLHRAQAMPFYRVPVIKAEATAIPIPDGGCDLMFASHIIEHLPDPRRFIAEIKRCSQRVYLEFPSRYRELMYAWSFHEWLVEAEGAVLRFYRDDLPQLFGGLFHAGYDAALGPWSDARHAQLNTSICCRSAALECEFPTETATEMLLRTSPRGSEKLDVARSIPRPRYSLGENAAFVAQSVLPVAVYDRLARLRRAKSSASPAPLPDAIVARLMCLQCRATTLRRKHDVLTCDCGARYVQDRGIFDFDPQG